ncbi:MAG: KH domain-containing protein [Candidatus Eisenbacteria bacterium]|uniref:KH domain-containing protein n=1 Tax=Eiseniibacteriota bacterium TaxID=2212470 RepID=A0A956LWN2_UNCEI|nr:KH domain-containing protein [Candidatus Eisenbacteria bacterium]
MGFPGKVSSRFDDGAYCLTVEAGDEDGILIGRKGETLDALQHVAYKMSGRGRDEASTVRIDISGYRERHEEELANEAVEMAKDVLATKRSRQTEPMRAADRRIVHRAISDLGGVTTRAIGTGLVKKILIEIEGASSEGDLAPSPRERAPQRAAGEVLDFVSEPTVDRGGAPVREQVASEWGRKPRPARPGRRR